MIQKLMDAIRSKNAPVVVGLDPNLAFVPDYLQDEARERVLQESASSEERTDEDTLALRAAAEAVWQFNKAIVDEVSDLVPAVKPQIAMYEQFGLPGLEVYDRTVRYCREKGLFIIGDVKRGDIGSTSASYAKAHIGRIGIRGRQIPVFDVDFATVNPYLGSDGIMPFVDVCNECDKGIFVLVKSVSICVRRTVRPCTNWSAAWCANGEKLPWTAATATSAPWSEPPGRNRENACGS